MFKRFLAIALLCCTLASCGWPHSALSSNLDQPSLEPSTRAQTRSDQANLATATFAGGCFWCMEGPFDRIDGVISTTSGYTGGQAQNPTYQQVSSGSTGHTESVQIVYDPQKVDYATLLETYWHNVDPLDSKGQFCDKGSQYRSGIFYATEAEQQLAEASKTKVAEQLKQRSLQKSPQLARSTPAEDYHQD
ncbi:MAG: peptide-methionine (S)-S-oxide reductase MsrA, partial [Synechococcales cyanobacterium RU_4_20]|nr:peptide-methionine (S)-S-oxide reductase MsrA [Synechococcales cyanobacterium RU_4_20]